MPELIKGHTIYLGDYYTDTPGSRDVIFEFNIPGVDNQRVWVIKDFGTIRYLTTRDTGGYRFLTQEELAKYCEDYRATQTNILEAKKAMLEVLKTYVDQHDDYTEKALEDIKFAQSLTQPTTQGEQVWQNSTISTN